MLSNIILSHCSKLEKVVDENVTPQFQYFPFIFATGAPPVPMSLFDHLQKILSGLGLLKLCSYTEQTNIAYRFKDDLLAWPDLSSQAA